jgi:hypothetical protein
VRAPKDPDPSEGLSLAAFASLPGLTEEAVESAELAGKFFSLRRPRRGGAREYPAFQAWRGVVGEPLESVLEALGHPTGAQAYAFFTSPQNTLCGLAPIEILQGETEARKAGQQIDGSWVRSPTRRLEVVLAPARTYALTLGA